MTDREPEQNQLNERSITAAAAAAVHDLQLEAEVQSVRPDNDRWCVQLTAEYGQLCDTFRDQFGKENSFELIREKVKRYLLKQQQNKIRSNVRIRKGKAERRPSSGTLVGTAVKTIQGVARQTAEVAGEIITQAAGLPEQALTALAATAKDINPTSQPARQSNPRAKQPLVHVTVKATAKKSKKKSSRSTRQAASKKGTAVKKAEKKGKHAGAKPTAKSGNKRGRTKKSTR